MELAPLSPIEKLTSAHSTDGFDCGKDALNQFLVRFALASRRAHSARTYVAARQAEVIGYYSLAVGSVEHAAAPERVGKGLARHPIPVMVLARLAIDRSQQGRGLGKGLFKDALRRTAAAADIAGIRALFVTAKDEGARQFYARYDLDPGPSDPLQLFLGIKDLQRLTRGR